MPTTKPNATSESSDGDLPVTIIFELLANERRQLALRYLRRSVGSVHVSDLADWIALQEGEHTFERYERVCTSLVHIHLPKLAESDVVRYDPERETVRISEAAGGLDPYLELATPTHG